MSVKTAFISGASAGIGRATAQVLAQAGYQLILLARREQRLLDLQSEIDVESHIIVCDINDHKKLGKALMALPKQFADIDVLVNNAGLALGVATADKAEWQDWQTMIETNCVSLAWMTRKILPRMVERNTGHIINIGSIAGDYAYKGGNVYGASKAFVDQLSINLRADLLGSAIRVTNVSPGMLGETEFSLVRFNGDTAAAAAVYQGYKPLKPEDIADSIRWVVEQPAHVNINRLEIMPTCQAPGGLALAAS